MSWLADANADAALIAWQINEAAGAVADNAATKGTPANYDGVISGDVILDRDPSAVFVGLGRRAYFNSTGTNGKVATSSNVPELHGVNKFSVEMFGGKIPTTALQNANTLFLYGTDAYNSATTAFMAFVHSQGTYIEYRVNTDAGALYSSNSLGSNWASDKTLLFTWDGSLGSANIKVYENGNATPVFTDNRTGTELRDAAGAALTAAYRFVAGNGFTGASAPMRLAGQCFALYDNIALAGARANAHYVSATTAGGNVAPTGVISVDLPASIENDDALTVEVDADDGNGDPLDILVEWVKNGATVIRSQLYAGVATPWVRDDSFTLTSAVIMPGDSLQVRFTLDDGTAAPVVVSTSTRVIVNRAPTATVAITPDPPTTLHTLTATATKNDADGQGVLLTYVWKKGAATMQTTGPTASLTDTYPLATAGNGDEGETITCELTPNDGVTDGAMVSDSVVIDNSAPAANITDFAPAAPRATETITATVARSDDDAGDAVSLLYEWYINLVLVRSILKNTGTGADLTDSLDLGAEGAAGGDVVDLDVTPNDGTVDGATVSASATVVATPSGTGGTGETSALRGQLTRNFRRGRV